MNDRRGVVNLTVHRNTRERRKRHAASEGMVNIAKSMARGKDVHGYVLITWDGTGHWRAAWRTGGEVGVNNVAQFVEGAMRREVAEYDAKALLNGGYPPEDEGA